MTCDKIEDELIQITNLTTREEEFFAVLVPPRSNLTTVQTHLFTIN